MLSYCETKRSCAERDAERLFICRHGLSGAFPGGLRKAAAKGIRDQDEASVAGRFLDQCWSAALPGTGSRRPSTGVPGPGLVALSDVLIQRGHAADLEYLDLADTNAEDARLGSPGDQRPGNARGDETRSTPSLELRKGDERRRRIVPDAGGVSLVLVRGRSREIDEASRHEWGISASPKWLKWSA